MSVESLRYGGIVPVLNTPFLDDLSIDFSSVERTVQRLIREGAAACIVPAVASEAAKLSLTERKTYLEHVLTAAAGSIPVIAGVTTDNAEATRDLARHAIAAGARAVLAQAPSELNADTDKVRLHFQALAELGADLLVIQDLEWHGPGMSIDLIVALFEDIPSFRAIKVETAPAGRKYSQILNATGGELTVSGGWSLPHMIEGLDRGVRTFHPTAIVQPFASVLAHYENGERARARDVLSGVLPALSWFSQHIDISVHFLKRYCVRRGDFVTHRVRQPILDFDEHHERIALELLDELLAFESTLGRGS